VLEVTEQRRAMRGGCAGTRYMVVDCGGGTVDITVHEMENESAGNLRELYKAAGGPHGSTGMFSAVCLSVNIQND